MSFSVSVTGHKDFSDPTAAADYEKEIREAVRELVNGLDGVVYASFTGGLIGTEELVGGGE